jgi:hypothetical protein
MRTALALLFIAGIAAAAVYVGRRPTVARGQVFAAQFLENSPLAKSIDCDDEIPIGLDGAKFHCVFHFRDGDHIDYEIEMDRALHISAHVLSESKPEHRHVPGADPWAD